LPSCLHIITFPYTTLFRSDEFFVSIAPFVETTHPCTNHSLTGCQGELVEKEFDVYIEDEEGNVVVDETMTSLKNGFIDFLMKSRSEEHTSELQSRFDLVCR